MESVVLRLRSSAFGAYLTTQFLGAFNDNAFKFALLVFLKATAESDVQKGDLWFLAQVLFAVPFIAFAAWAGALADRLPKSGVIRGAKVAEIFIMLAGAAAFAVGSVPGLLTVLFIMSIQSTIFGPGKYGYLAETVPPRDLSRANGVVQMTTMVSAISGQIVGAFLLVHFADRPGVGATAFVGFAVLGTLTSLRVPAIPAARPDEPFPWNPLPGLAATWREVRGHRPLLYTMLGIGHFWLLGALLQVELLDFAGEVLGMNEVGGAYLAGTATLGIALGSLLAARWSGGQMELGLVPLGALGMSLGLVCLAWTDPLPAYVVVSGLPNFTFGERLFDLGAWKAFAVVLSVGAAGGLFIVPLQAALQHEAPARDKGRFTAFGNMVSFMGICLSALFLGLKGRFGLSSGQQLLLAASLSLAGTLVSLRMLPYAFVRTLGWLLTHTFYRIRVRHLERLPRHGGVLVLCNHVSWVDALILGVTSGRSVHFLMYRRYFEWWPTRWLFQLVGCIPVASGDAPEVVEQSLREAGRELDQGRVVVIFAEGAVTRLGHMLPFRRGYQRIIAGRQVPIVPVHLDGLWGSVFSHQGGRLLWKLPRKFPYPVTVTWGEPLPSSAEPHELREAIRGLSCEAWGERRRDRAPLPLTLLHEERRAFRRSVFDDGGQALSPARLLARATVLARAWRRRLGDARHVGLVARRGCDAVGALLALQLAGRVPVFVQAELPDAERTRRLRAAGVEACVVGRDVSLPDDWDGPVFALEVELARLSATHERVVALLHAFVPLGLLRRFTAPDLSADVDAPAAVVFTRDGDAPKPVLLSHFNVLSNVEAVQMVLEVDRNDGVLGVLPLDSAYGQVMTVWFPLLSRVRVAWHADPARARELGKLCERRRCSLLPATPALLEAFVEGTRPDGFGSLRLVLCAEGRLAPELRRRFEARFGIHPREAYALTEAGGLVSLNTLDVRRAGVFQRGTRQGTVGHPLPGVTVAAVDSASGAALPYGRTGSLVVSGPGVMLGYVDDEAGTAAVLHGQALRVGDVGCVDEEGFVTLERRAGGERSGPPQTERRQGSDAPG